MAGLPTKLMFKGVFLPLLLLCVGGIVQQACAEPESASAQMPENLFGMSLEDLLGMEVSTASKFGGNADKAPGNLVVVTQDEIRRYGYRTLGEAVERAAGFFNRDVVASASISFRGLTPSDSASSSRILYLIDGMKANSWTGDEILTNEDFPVDIENIDRIEILKGAGSAIWGSNALYGVVNVITKDSASARNKVVMGQVSSYHQQKGYVSWGGKTGGGIKMATSFSYTDGKIPQNSFYPSVEATDFFNPRVYSDTKTQNSRGSLKLNYDNFYTNFVYGLNRDNIEFRGDPDSNHSDFQFGREMLDTGYKMNVWKEYNGELQLRGFWTSAPTQQFATFPGETSFNPGYFYYSGYEKSGGGEVRYSHNIYENLKALVGFEATRVYKAKTVIDQGTYSLESGDVSLLSTSSSSVQRTVQNYYTDLNFTPSKQISLFVGGRLDKTSELDSVFGPRVSLIYTPVKDTVFKLNYSKGFRNPSISESKVYTPAPFDTHGEELTLYEAGVEQRFEKWLSIRAAAFRSDLSDAIGIGTVDDTGLYYANTEGFRSTGVELEAKAIGSEIQGYTSFSFSHAEDKITGDKIDSIPHYLARAGISWHYNDLIIASPELQYGSSSSILSGYRFDPYLVTNLTLLSYPTSERASVSLSIYNLFNDHFTRINNGTPNFEQTVENGRALRLQFSLEL